MATSKVFGVSLLRATQCWISRRFAMPQRADKLAEVPLLQGNCAFLSSTELAHLECELHLLVPAGDHVLVLGHVVQATSAEQAEPLVYAHGAYHRLGEPCVPIGSDQSPP